jgi:hypothetical protein
MSNTVTYDCGRAGTAILYNPTITVAHMTEISRYRQYTVLVRITHTIRGLIVAADSASLKTTMEAYRTILSVSGGVFSAQYGNSSSFLYASPGTDITGGPHPISLNIQELHGGKSAIVTWSLQTEKHVADDNVNAVGAWLDFVYTITTTIDANFYGRRTISGILRLSACHTQTRYRSADAFRQTIETNIAGIPVSGIWQRISRDYRLSEDNRILAFTIVDQQLYTALPYGVSQGDMTLTVIAEKGGIGRYIMNGWFEGSADLARGAIQTHVRDIWQLFFNLVITRIETETAGDEQWAIINERRMYVTHWRSNRIEFSAEYEVLGEWERGIPENIEYTVNRALDWLAYLSRSYNRAIIDQGPYGSAPTIGPTGREYLGPIILIDPMEKLPAGFAYGSGTTPPHSGGRDKNTTRGVAVQKTYIIWHQHFAYTYDTGQVFVPVLTADACDIIQQVRNPSLYMTVTGEAERIGGEPDIPYFPFPQLDTAVATDSIDDDEPKLILIKSDVGIAEPSPVNVYRVTWKNLYKFHNIGKRLPLKWPYTPLNEEKSDQLLTTKPAYDYPL